MSEQQPRPGATAVDLARELATAYRKCGTPGFIAAGLGAGEDGRPVLYAYWNSAEHLPMTTLYGGLRLIHKVMGQPTAAEREAQRQSFARGNAAVDAEGERQTQDSVTICWLEVDLETGSMKQVDLRADAPDRSLVPGQTPEGYRCSRCGVRGAKLWWRQNTDVADELFCADCGESEQRPLYRSDWDSQFRRGTGDSIGLLVPALPTDADLTSYWPHPSVPPEGLAWWQGLDGPAETRAKATKAAIKASFADIDSLRDRLAAAEAERDAALMRNARREAELRSIAQRVGQSEYSSRPLMCFVQDLVYERDALRARAEAADRLNGELRRAMGQMLKIARPLTMIEQAIWNHADFLADAMAWTEIPPPPAPQPPSDLIEREPWNLSQEDAEMMSRVADPNDPAGKATLRAGPARLSPWIPVAERMPEPDSRVLTCAVDGYVQEASWLSDRWWNDSWPDAKPKDYATHWMPMPDAVGQQPKEDARA